MTDWAIGLSTGCFYQTPILEVLESIRNGGFSLLEVCSYPEHLDYHDPAAVREAGQRLGALGLEPFSFHAPFADEIDITSLNPDRREHSLIEILRAADAAARLGVRHFVIHPGPEQEGKPPAEERLRRLENAAGVLDQVARRCRDNAMTLILENMLPHLLFGQTSDMLWILGALEQMNVGTCLDTGHAHLAGDIYTVMHKLSGHLKMIHANDNKGNNDDHLPPGRGHIDWERLVARLLQHGFHGPCIIEISAETAEDAPGILAEARRARGFLRELTRK